MTDPRPAQTPAQTPAPTPAPTSASGSAPPERLALARLRAERVLTVVRSPSIDDPASLVRALVAGGIASVELTFTTPGVLDLVRAIAPRAAEHGASIGVGTVTDAGQAAAALDAGATFLVTPGLVPDSAAIVDRAHDVGAAVLLGALTPSEVAQAMAWDADAVKIFPARAVGPGYLRDLRGPFPDVLLVPSGGVDESNAADYLDAGALAVTAGTSVVAPDLVAAGRWDDIAARARVFCTALSTRTRTSSPGTSRPATSRSGTEPA